MTVEVAYGVDWHAGEARLVRPLSAGEARRRHEAGEPYTVLLRAGDVPGAVFRSCRANAIASLDLFDAAGRRERAYDFREIWTDHLHLLRLRTWPPQPWDEDDTPDRTANISTDGGARIIRRTAGGGSLHSRKVIPGEHRTVPLPAFGDWSGLLGAEPTTVPAPAPVRGSAADTLRPTWAEPTGLRPGNLAALFTAGSRLRAHYGVTEIREPEDAGLLQVPTGRIIAADPATLDERDQPFTVTVAPGAYPVQIARMRWDEHPWGETPAARLVIRAEVPTVSWELAVRPGQDLRMLNEGEFFGFGVDSGTGCFLDLAARDAAVAAIQDDPGAALSSDEGTMHARWRDPATGFDLVAYASGYGDGSYPVWIGRGEDGEVTCLLADMLVLNQAESLEPTQPDVATFLRPAPQPLPAADAPTAGTLAAATAYLLAL
jgi:hypothetical protein